MRRWLPRSVLEEPYSLLASGKAIRRFKDRHRGERCVIVGNGPSLNEIDLSRLDGVPSFAVNGIFYKTDEMGYRPQYYVVEDRAVMADNFAAIKEYRPAEGGARFFSSRYRGRIPGPDTYFLNLNRSFYEPRSSYFEVPRFSVDAARHVFCGQSVTIVNLQLAYFMGFSEVYLIGMDFSYTIPDSAKIEGNVIESTEDDPNHFHPDYFGAGRKWHDPKLHNVLKSYQLAKAMFEMDGRRIINATVGGNLHLFDRADFHEVF